MGSTDKDEIFTLEELAEFLRVHYQTAWKLVNEGKIPAAKLGVDYKILKSDAITYVKQLRDERMEKVKKRKK